MDELKIVKEEYKAAVHRNIKLTEKYNKLRSLYDKIRKGRDPLKLRCNEFEKWYKHHLKEIVSNNQEISNLRVAGGKVSEELIETKRELRSLRKKYRDLKIMLDKVI